MLCDRDPEPRWVDGRVALLGDAAHPMLQYFAQGASMSMEDAVCLASTLAEHSNLASVLARYQEERFTRTARVQLGSRLIGDYIYHPDGGAAAARNAILSQKTPQDWYDDLDWLYGHGRDAAGEAQTA